MPFHVPAQNYRPVPHAGFNEFITVVVRIQCPGVVFAQQLLMNGVHHPAKCIRSYGSPFVVAVASISASVADVVFSRRNC